MGYFLLKLKYFLACKKNLGSERFWKEICLRNFYGFNTFRTVLSQNEAYFLVYVKGLNFRDFKILDFITNKNEGIFFPNFITITEIQIQNFWIFSKFFHDFGVSANSVWGHDCPES